MKIGWIIFWTILMLLVLYVGYLDFFVCGDLEGTMSDIPRWCWWLR